MTITSFMWYGNTIMIIYWDFLRCIISIQLSCNPLVLMIYRCGMNIEMTLTMVEEDLER